MPELPFTVAIELEGWALFWVDLELQDGGRDELSRLRSRIAADVRRNYSRETLTQRPAVAALRKLFRAAGCDPTRYRPSSEALLRRVTNGDELPVIHPFVDLGNCLSAALAVPVCVMAEGTTAPPFVFRSGSQGEGYDSLRGPFKADGKPLLLDAIGPCDTPITGSQRVKVTSDTRRVWLVAYLPAEIVSHESARAQLTKLLAEAPVADVLQAGAFRG